MSAEMIDATEEANTVDAQKRAFMKKFGRYAIAGAGMATLMTPTLSSANNYNSGTVIKIQTSHDHIMGSYANDANNEAGQYHGEETSRPNYYKGKFYDTTHGANQWAGQWTFSENGDFSGSGDIYDDNQNDIGDWSATGHNYIGRYTLIWQ